MYISGHYEKEKILKSVLFFSAFSAHCRNYKRLAVHIYKVCG